MLALVDGLQNLRQVDRALCAQRIARDLAVEDLAGDVGVIGRHLAPALIAGIGVTRTKPMNRVVNVSSLLIFMGRIFDGKRTENKAPF